MNIEVFFLKSVNLLEPKHGMNNQLHALVCLMVFSATFNNISVILWQSVLLVEETGETTDLSQVTDKLYHIMVYISNISTWLRFELTTSVVIGTDCISSCKIQLLCDHGHNDPSSLLKVSLITHNIEYLLNNLILTGD